MIKNSKKIENVLVSEIRNLLTEFTQPHFSEEQLMSYVSLILQATEIDSKIVVNVLEQFGHNGRGEAMIIKMKEGW